MGRNLVRVALWFCAGNFLAATLAAQCPNPVSTIPDQNVTAGTSYWNSSGSLKANNYTVSGSASMNFVSGQCVELAPNFHATAGTAPTTFHAWVDALPTVSTASPAYGTGVSQQFTWTASSPYGNAYLTALVAAIGNSTLMANSCYIIFNASSNVLQLYNNSGNSSSSLVVGTNNTVANSQCSIYGCASSVNRSGNQLALTVAVTFQPAYAGPHNQYLWALDQAGLGSDFLQVGTWTVGTPTGFTPIRISAGGPYTDSLGQAWSADYGYLQGSTYPTSAAITGTPDQRLYQTERYNGPTLTYQFAVPNGNYAVTLKLAEIYDTAAGQRYMNIAMNGTTVVTGLDVWTATGGPNRSYDLSFPVSVTNGQLTISLTCTSPNNSAEVNAIQIVASSSPPPLTISTASLPSGQQGTAYYQTLSATGGTTPYTWWLVSGALPFGIGLNSSTGVLSGTPSAVCSPCTFTIGVTDSASHTATQMLSLTISASGGTTVTVTPGSVSVGPGGAQQFLATVTGNANTGVTWSKSGLGSIDSNGVYAAPASVPSPSTVTITATSVADATKQASVAVALQPSFSITVPTDIGGAPVAPYVQPGNSVGLYLATSPSASVSYSFTTSNPGITVSTPSGSHTSAIATISVSSGVAPGTYIVTIQSSPGASNQPMQVSINVIDATANPMTGLRPNTQTEINMGFIPFASKTAYYGQPWRQGAWYDNYHDVVVGNDYGTVASPVYPVLAANCTALPDGTKPVRTCIRQILAKYKAQGITGVRFQFTINDALWLAPGTSSAPAPGCVSLFGAPCIRSQWISEVTNFFSDLKEFGITNITPTIEVEASVSPWVNADNSIAPYSQWYDASNGTAQLVKDGDRYVAVSLAAQSLPSSCSTYLPPSPPPPAPPVLTTFRFTPTSPYAERCKAPQGKTCDINGTGSDGKFYGWDIDRGVYFADGVSSPSAFNDSYACSPANPIFVGWPVIEGVVGEMLQLASEQTLTVEELDARNEIDLEYYPVRARMIVDNTDTNYAAGRDVLGDLQGLMSTHGFRSDRVTYSAMDVVLSDTNVNAPAPGQSPNPQVSQSEAIFDCGSLWGDSAREHGASQLLSAISGGFFGLYYDFLQTMYTVSPVTYGLPCIVAPGESLTQTQITARIDNILGINNFDVTNPNPMAIIGMGHNAPSILDVHTAPCINVRIPVLDPSGARVIDHIDDDGTVHYKTQLDCDPIVANVAGANGLYLSDPGSSEVAQTARTQFNALNSILQSYSPGGWRYGNPNNANLANAIVMLGESYGQLGNTRGPLNPGNQGTGCKLFGQSIKQTDGTWIAEYTTWEKLRENAFFIAAGFNLSYLACTSPNNCQSAASKTVFRPWENLALQPYYTDQYRQQPDKYGPDPASCEPVVINLPFTPSNPLNK
jgi:hypothetical protein